VVSSVYLLLVILTTHIVFACKWGPRQTGNKNTHFHTVRWLPCTLDLVTVVTLNSLGVSTHDTGSPVSLNGLGSRKV